MVSSSEQDDLSAALGALGPPGVLIGCRTIGPDDEQALLPDEAPGLAGRAPRVRRQSAAARIAARALLGMLGLAGAAVPKSPAGAPIWPAGIVGSLAHDDAMAIAAIAASAQFDALGVDVEPALPLPEDIVHLVATPTERARYSSAVVNSRILFCVKEAIYKALNPLDGVFLDFHDIEVDLATRQGRTRHGLVLDIAAITDPRVVALAFRRV